MKLSKQTKHLLWTVLAVVCVSCVSPKEMLEQNNFSGAYRYALAALRKGKDEAENKEVLIAALQMLIEQEQGRITRLAQSPDFKKNKKAIAINEKLQGKIERAAPFTGDTFTAIAQQLPTERAAIQEDIADRYFQLGVDQLHAYRDSNLKQKARNAHANFIEAKAFGYDHPELEALLAESLQSGQLIYAIYVSTLFNISHSWEINRTMEDLENCNTRFRQVFYDPGTLQQEVDCNIQISFHSLDVDIKESENREEVEKEITVIETVTNAVGEEEEVEKTITVSATLITKTTTKTAAWRVDVDVSGTQNCGARGTWFEQSVASTIETTSFEGDERAVPFTFGSPFDEELKDDDEMAEELLGIIFNDVRAHLF